jgi:uncharacterized phage protein (TIGR02220 family)
MARPIKEGVDYFSHDTNAHVKKTLTILCARHGNDGYAVWFKTLELLGTSRDLSLDLSDDESIEYTAAIMLVPPEKLIEIYDLLARINAIDADLWKARIVWSDQFADRLKDAYQKRAFPEKPTGRILVNPDKTPVNPDKTPENAEIMRERERERKGKEKGKEKERLYVGQARLDLGDDEPEAIEAEKVDEPDLIAGEVIDRLNSLTGARFRPDGKEARKSIGARIADGHTLDELLEVVEKKNAEWHGTDMERYLRPSTLFRPSKFEEYLAQPWPRVRGPTGQGKMSGLASLIYKSEMEKRNGQKRDTENTGVPEGRVPRLAPGDAGD